MRGWIRLDHAWVNARPPPPGGRGSLVGRDGGAVVGSGPVERPRRWPAAGASTL